MRLCSGGKKLSKFEMVKNGGQVKGASKIQEISSFRKFGNSVKFCNLRVTK